MRRVVLESLCMTNFKGEQRRETLFDPLSTTIAGANGLGKSRHFEAFVWLLFGKDMQDRTNYEVKTRLADGSVLHKVECSVEGVLVVDAVRVRLKRSLVENWVKPRGQAEQVYKGDQTECWWNEAPISVTEYNKRVAEIIDTNVFKMVTNPMFFANMKWQLQREQLFALAGTVSDEELAEGNDSYRALLDKIGGKPLADFKAEHNAKKKRLRAELAEIQPRIDQTYKLMPSSEDDYAALEERCALLDEHIAALDGQLSSVASSEEAQLRAHQELLDSIASLQQECVALVSVAQGAADVAAYKANSERRAAEYALSDKRAELSRARRALSLAERELSRVRGEIEKYTSRQETLRAAWRAENAKVFTGSGVCPVCGSQLSAAAVGRERAAFEKEKALRCAANVTEGRQVGELLARERGELETAEGNVAQCENVIGSLEAEEVILSEAFNSMAEVSPAVVRGEDIPEWVAKQQELVALQERLSSWATPSDATRAALVEQRNDLCNARAVLVDRLAEREHAAACMREIEALEALGRDLSQQIAAIEGDEYVLQEFTRAKMTECEQRVNSLFTLVSFRLFDYTLEGNAMETCVALINGVPYGSANTASQINAGIDIINALCRFYGVSAPIFIDRRESVNDLLLTDSQVINLRVSEDRELIITNH